MRAGTSHREVKDAGAHQWRARTRHILWQGQPSPRSERKERLRWLDLSGSENDKSVKRTVGSKHLTKYAIGSICRTWYMMLRLTRRTHRSSAVPSSLASRRRRALDHFEQNLSRCNPMRDWQFSPSPCLPRRWHRRAINATRGHNHFHAPSLPS